jgi:hypothetical protein
VLDGYTHLNIAFNVFVEQTQPVHEDVSEGWNPYFISKIDKSAFKNFKFMAI